MNAIERLREAAEVPADDVTVRRDDLERVVALLDTLVREFDRLRVAVREGRK